MQYLHFDLPLRRVRLFPLGDWHYGSKQCDERFVIKIVKMIEADPEAKWFSLGDLLENAIIGSKSDVYTQTESPGSQLNNIVELLKPIAGKCLGMVPGNHEERTMRLVGLHPSSLIAKLLGVPYAVFSALVTLDLLEGHTPRSFSCYFHHGAGGGYTAGGKIQSLSKIRLIAPTVDALFCGHGHLTARTPVTWVEPGHAQYLKKRGYNYMIGSTLTWDESYAEEKAKVPATVEQIAVTFIAPAGGNSKRRQIYEVIEPD